MVRIPAQAIALLALGSGELSCNHTHSESCGLLTSIQASGGLLLHIGCIPPRAFCLDVFSCFWDALLGIIVDGTCVALNVHGD